MKVWSEKTLGGRLGFVDLKVNGKKENIKLSVGLAISLLPAHSFAYDGHCGPRKTLVVVIQAVLPYSNSFSGYYSPTF